MANDKGEIFIIQDADVRQYINSAFNDLGLGVSVIAPFSKGFIVGSDNGNMAIWVKLDETDKVDGLSDEGGVSFLKRWHTERKSGIMAMDITQTEDMIAVSF